MLNINELGARIIFSFGDGKLFITESTLFGILIAVFLAILGIWLGSRLEKVPRGKQVFAEFIVEWVYKFTEKHMGKANSNFAPYIGTLLAFVFCASSLGVFGVRPITADLNVAFALSIMTMAMIVFNSTKVHGFRGRLKHMCEPYVFMLPLKILEEISLPISLGLRIFGNILGGYIIVELWMHLMTKLSNFFSDVPFLRAITVIPLNAIFDIAEPAIQTFIFTILTVINLAAAMKITATVSNNENREKL